MIYAYQMRHGQVYCGFFVADPKAPSGYKLVKRSQHRSRTVADGHFEKAISAAASRYQTWTAVLVMGEDSGHINPYTEEQAARDAIKTAQDLGHVKRCYLFGPDGSIVEIPK